MEEKQLLIRTNQDLLEKVGGHESPHAPQRITEPRRSGPSEAHGGTPVLTSLQRRDRSLTLSQSPIPGASQPLVLVLSSGTRPAELV